jgi:hypothetical protein
MAFNKPTNRDEDMSNLEIFQKPFGVKNYLNTCVEFFNAPLPLKSSETDENFSDAFDLFQQSSRESYFEPVFIPSDGDVIICNLDIDHFELIPDTDQIVSGKDFLKFQLQKINIETLIQIPTRVDFSLSEETIKNLLKETLDPSIEVDETDGYPIDEIHWPEWLYCTDCMFNIHKPDEEEYLEEWEENVKTGMEFLEKFRKTHPDLLLNPLVEAILDNDWGIYNNWETKIENVSAVSNAYSNWNCPLMVMYSGKFWPQYTTSGFPSLHSSDYKIYDVHIRNNDEGEPI